MSTHGRTGLAHLFFGSDAERVVRYAHCPVLVLRRPRRLGKGGFSLGAASSRGPSPVVRG
jgi:hypothetical protein